MSIRFFRRVRIAPGVSLNLSKTGASVSVGPPGTKLTVGGRGTRATVGVPGTGLYYTRTLSGGGSARSTRQVPSAYGTGAVAQMPMIAPNARLTLNFFQRLTAPTNEKKLVEGCRALSLDNEEEALLHLTEAAHLADGAYLAGFLALRHRQLDKAAAWLAMAQENHKSLGQHFDKYGINALMTIAITDEVVAYVEPNLRGVLLGQVEVYQELGQHQQALACLEHLYELEADDVVVKLSLAECLLDTRPAAPSVCQRVVRLAQDVQNETEIHGGLLLYKARALRDLDLGVAARDVLTYALRRHKNRPTELLQALRYERAQVYANLGRHRQARAEYEKLYAEDPDYEDVAQKLGF